MSIGANGGAAAGIEGQWMWEKRQHELITKMEAWIRKGRSEGRGTMYWSVDNGGGGVSVRGFEGLGRLFEDGAVGL